MSAARPRYRATAIVLHWTIAGLILLQVALGLRMGEARTPETFAVFQLHKSVGITILLLSLARLGWRLANPPPPLPADMAAWERALARLSHAGFYLVMIAMPLTGWLMVSTSRLRLPTLLYGAVPWPDLPGFAALTDATRESWRIGGAIGHKGLALLFGLLFVLHVTGALKHQLAGDAVLTRMAPGARPRRLLEPRLLAILLFAGLAVAAGALVSPPRPHVLQTRSAPAMAPAPADAPAQTGEAPATWTVEPGSRLGFTAAWGGQPISGRFDHWRAEIVFSPHALARSRVRVEVELASVFTDNPQRDAVLPGADWLGAPAHPTAIFVADSFQALGGGRFVAHGALTLKGVTGPSDLAFTLAIAGGEARVIGSASVDRTAFGVGQGEWRATDQIPAAVAVTLDLKARTKNITEPVGESRPASSLDHEPGSAAPARTNEKLERRPR